MIYTSWNNCGGTSAVSLIKCFVPINEIIGLYANGKIISVLAKAASHHGRTAPPFLTSSLDGGE
jgi:hypothetical protein